MLTDRIGGLYDEHSRQTKDNGSIFPCRSLSNHLKYKVKNAVKHIAHFKKFLTGMAAGRNTWMASSVDIPTMRK